jgi:hypothetical protein
MSCLKSKKAELTLPPRSGFLQNNRPRRACQLHPQNLRERHGRAHAQAYADGQEAGAHDSDGQGHDGRAGERGEGCAGAAFPSGAGDAEEGEFDEIVEVVPFALLAVLCSAFCIGWWLFRLFLAGICWDGT